MDPQELDDDEVAIRKYILQNPKYTENKVALAMQDAGQCHRLTALKKIANLKERDIVVDLKRKQNSFSCLIVKDENEFKWIVEHLSKIEKFNREPTKSKPQKKARHDFIIHDLLLALFRTNTRIKSQDDRQVLNQRIIELMLEIRFKTARPVFSN